MRLWLWLVDRRLIKAIFVVDDTWHRSIEKWHYIQVLSLNESTVRKKVSEYRDIEEDIDEEDLLLLKKLLPDGFDFIELKDEIENAILIKVLKIMQSIEESARVLMIGMYAITSMIERHSIKNRDFRGKTVKSIEEKREELIRRITETEFKIVKDRIEKSLLEYNYAGVSADVVILRLEYPNNERVQGYLDLISEDPDKEIIKLSIKQLNESLKINDFEEANLILQELMSFERPGMAKLIKFHYGQIGKAREIYSEQERKSVAYLYEQYIKALPAHNGDVKAAIKAVLKNYQGGWPVYANILHLTLPNIKWGDKDIEGIIRELVLPDKLLKYLENVKKQVKGYKQSGALKEGAIAVCRKFDYYGGTTEGLFREILNRICQGVELLKVYKAKDSSVYAGLLEGLKSDIDVWEILAQAYNSREEKNRITDIEIGNNIGRNTTDSLDILEQRETGSGI